MILEDLKKLNEGEIVLTEDLAIQLNEEAKKKFKDGGFDLTDEAIEEARNSNFDSGTYKSLLTKLRNSNFPTNHFLQSQALKEYKSGIIDIEKLFEEHSIQRLAQLYNAYSSQMDNRKLFLLNSERGLSADAKDVIKKTTFVHQLFEEKVPRKAILNFFLVLKKVSWDDKDLIYNYLDLSDENGKTIRDIIAQESGHGKFYEFIDTEIDKHYLSLKLRNAEQNIASTNFLQEDTHTESIHGSVDKSFSKLALSYNSDLVKETSNHTVSIDRTIEWEDKIGADLKKFEVKLRAIISSDQEIDEFLSPTLTKGENIESLREKFKFQTQTALRLIDGLKNGSYGKSYEVLTNELVSCGLTPKEIVAISYASLSDKDLWHNKDQETQHFIQFVEHLYNAKRGYNIDHHGEDEWKTHPQEADDNKCTGGTVNEIANGLKDHKSVTIKVITANTMSPIMLTKLPSILERIAKDGDGLDGIRNWFSTGIISKQLSDKIVSALKQNEEFTKEFSDSEIIRIAPQVLNKYNLNQLNNLSSRLSQLNITEQFDIKKISSFIYKEERGYILYLESLYYKDPNLFESSLKNILSGIDNNHFDKYTRIDNLAVDLLLSSSNKQIAYKTAEIFRRHLERLSQEDKDQYLLVSCSYGISNIAEILIASGANVNARDTGRGREDQTPLMLAARNGNARIINKLIEAGADKEARDNGGRTALTYAEGEAVIELINAGADIESKDNHGHTELMYAIFGEDNKGKEKLVLLINAGADLEAKDGNGRTALMWAVQEDKKEMASILIEARADLEAKDRLGCTALIYVVNNRMGLRLDIARDGRQEIASMLIKAGADLEAKDENGRTALMRAVQEEKKEIASMLIKDGADLEAKDKFGYTTLMLAALNGQEETVITLIKAGADLEAKDKTGRTALMWAALNGQEETVITLIKAGADIEAKDKTGRTALMWAVREEKKEMLAALLELNYDNANKEITVNGMEPKKISKAISTLINQGSGYIYDDERSWELIQKIVKKIPKEQQLEVIGNVFEALNNTSRRDRLLSFVPEEVQLLIRNNVKPTLLEAAIYTTNLVYGNSLGPDIQPRKKHGRTEEGDDAGHIRKYSRTQD